MDCLSEIIDISKIELPYNIQMESWKGEFDGIVLSAPPEFADPEWIAGTYKVPEMGPAGEDIRMIDDVQFDVQSDELRDTLLESIIASQQLDVHSEDKNINTQAVDAVKECGEAILINNDNSSEDSSRCDTLLEEIIKSQESNCAEPDSKYANGNKSSSGELFQDTTSSSNSLDEIFLKDDCVILKQVAGITKRSAANKCADEEAAKDPIIKGLQDVMELSQSLVDDLAYILTPVDQIMDELLNGPVESPEKDGPVIREVTSAPLVTEGPEYSLMSGMDEAENGDCGRWPGTPEQQISNFMDTTGSATNDSNRPEDKYREDAEVTTASNKPVHRQTNLLDQEKLPRGLYQLGSDELIYVPGIDIVKENKPKRNRKVRKFFSRLLKPFKRCTRKPATD